MNRNLFCENVLSKWALFNSLFSNCPKYSVCSSKFYIELFPISFGTLNHYHKVPEYLIRGESKFSKINSPENKSSSSLYHMSVA